MEPEQINMIDVTQKKETERQAIAGGKVQMKPSTLELIRKGELEKGDVLAVAKTAGIIAAKETHRLIPLCHPLQLTHIAVEFNLPKKSNCVEIKTGFEMEALVAVSVSALTIYDMCKAVDRSMIIGDIRLVRKSGGKSGLFLAD